MHIVSIIVPVYNVERYLDKCIQSILKQTFYDFEVILVDDGSTDNSGKICDKYGKLDSRVKVIHKKNGGLSSARNKGIEVAKGNFIAFIDSDDYIHNQMLEILYKGINQNNSDISICKYKRFKENEIIKDKTYDIESISFKNYTNIEALSNLQSESVVEFVIACNKLYRKELFNNLRYEDGRIHEDEFIIHKLLYKCNLVSYTSAELYYYLRRDNSIMALRNNNSILDALDAYGERIVFYKNIKQKQFIKDAELIYVREFLNYYQMLKNIQDNKNLLKKEMIKKFRTRIFGILKNYKFTIKEKMLFTMICINPNIYDNYQIIRKWRIENGK